MKEDKRRRKRIFTEEWKKNMSLSAKKRFIDKKNHPMFGTHRNEKTKKLIGEKSKANWKNPTENMIEGVKKQAETKRRLHKEGKLIIWSKGLKGIKTNDKGRIPYNKGLKGLHKDSEETKRKKSEASAKREHTIETKMKLSEMRKGAKNPAWKDGISPINKRVRRSIEYREWRKMIFERDNYICQICGIRGNKLNVNHIKKFSDYLELRFDINNGITLCKNCHFSLVNKHEEEWESYFNFNLATRGFIEDEFISRRLE